MCNIFFDNKNIHAIQRNTQKYYKYLVTSEWFDVDVS